MENEAKEVKATEVLVPYTPVTALEPREETPDTSKATAMILSKVMDRLEKLETTKAIALRKNGGTIEELVDAAKELVVWYLHPGKTRFKKVVALRKAIERYEKERYGR